MIETFQKYSGSGLMLCWFVVAWLYLFVKEKKKDRRVMFVYAPAVVLLIFFNPLFYKVFSGVSDEAIYFRFLWLIPVSPVIAYAIISIYNELTGRKRTAFVIVALFLIMVSGKLIYANPLYSRAENPYHVPQSVVNICDAIEVEGREVMAVFPEEMLYYVRQYSAVVCMPYGREVFMETYNELHQLMRQDTIDVEKAVPLIKQYGCHYVIFSETKILQGSFEDYGYVLVNTIDGYKIYQDVSIYIGL